MESTQWCSLFCTGNEAVGELTLPFEDNNGIFLDIPICAECLETVMQNQKEALARILGPVVDS